MKIIKREAMFIPIKDITPTVIRSVKAGLSYKFYEDKSCKVCDNYAQRHNDLCDSCASYKGGVELATSVTVGNKKYLKVPIGSFANTCSKLRGEIEIVDKARDTKISPVKFTGTLKPEQVEAMAAMLKVGRGVMKAPPRSGKTVTGTAFICELGMKALVLASQRDWLIGFQETFIGSKTQAPLTDLDSKRIKVCKTLEDFKTTDIALATVQTFYSENGQKLLRQIRSLFPVILIDETQYGNANKFIKILATFNSKYMIGLSATPQRKDMREILVENVVGSVFHEVKTVKLRPQVRLTKSTYQKSYKGQTPWPRMVSSLENDEQRLKLIADVVVQDIKAGHMVLLPFAQVKPIARVIKLINDLAGKEVAFPFTGKEKKEVRDLTIQRAREYKIKCLVGTQKILSVGINIPRASCLIEQALSSNLPNAEQRYARVLTPMDNKPQPIIRFILDEMNVRKNCLRNEYWNCLKPKYKPIISDQDSVALKSYFSSKPSEKFEW